MRAIEYKFLLASSIWLYAFYSQTRKLSATGLIVEMDIDAWILMNNR